MGSHKAPHRRKVTIGKSGCRRGVPGLALGLTLILGLSLGTVDCQGCLLSLGHCQ